MKDPSDQLIRSLISTLNAENTDRTFLPYSIQYLQIIISHSMDKEVFKRLKISKKSKK